MKKQLITGSLLAFATIANAQWDNPTAVNVTPGNIGIGITGSPAFRLDISSGVTDDGIKVTQTGSNGAWLFLNNQTFGGRQWGIASLGNGNGAGSGNFSIYDIGIVANRFFIQGSTGNVGIGTTSPAARLHALSEDVGVRGDAISSVTGLNLTGVMGKAVGTTTNHIVCGVHGEATSGGENFGGYFTATGTGLSPSFGIYATVVSPQANDFAAYFDGDTYSTGSYLGSDRKLKDNIKPLTSALDKINLLKPSTYTFKTGEYKSMNLPQGEQMGLIAQELETVFPGLIKEVAARTERNDKGEITASTPDYKSVNYVGLIPVLISGIQEQQKTIEQQSKVNADLQKQLNEQSDLIKTLSQKVSGTTGINSAGGVENGFQMLQNEPNPFTHETVVNYTLPQTVISAAMVVYDLTGKQITALPIQDKGASSLTITSEKLSAGIYIYSIVADGKVIDSKRMIVSEK